MFARICVVTHSLVTLPYLIVTLADLFVLPGGIQDITLVHLLAHCSLVDFFSIRV